MASSAHGPAARLQIVERTLRGLHPQEKLQYKFESSDKEKLQDKFEGGDKDMILNAATACNIVHHHHYYGGYGDYGDYYRWSYHSHREHESEESEYTAMPSGGKPNQITIMHDNESEESE